MKSECVSRTKKEYRSRRIGIKCWKKSNEPMQTASKRIFIRIMYIYRKDTSNGKLLKRGGELIVDCFGQIHEVIYENAKLSLASLERKRYRQ